MQVNPPHKTPRNSCKNPPLVSIIILVEKDFFAAELFRLKYDDNWLAMYEHAKTSFNNRANELKSDERKSGGSIEPNDEAGVAANIFAPDDQA